MSTRSQTQQSRKTGAAPHAAGGLLQRKCACGTHTVAGGECDSCSRGREGAAQRPTAAGGAGGAKPANTQNIHAGSGFGRDFSRVPAQPRIASGAHGDAYEREAEKVADDLLREARRPAPAHATHDAPAPRNARQEGEPRPQLSPSPVSLSTASAGGAGGAEAPESLGALINESRGGGRPLTGRARDFFQRRLGYDLGGVRLHTDSRAHEMNRTLGAQAFTLGPDIYFGEGQYAPDSEAGLHLLAHELTHTVQQGALAAPLVQARGGTKTPQKKLVSMTLMVDLDKLILDLEDGTRVTILTSYNGKPRPGTYLATRQPNGSFSIRASGGTANADGNVIVWQRPDNVTLEGVNKYYLRIVGTVTDTKPSTGAGEPGGGGAVPGQPPGTGGGEGGGGKKEGGTGGGEKEGGTGGGKVAEGNKGGGETPKTGEPPSNAKPLSPEAYEQWRALNELMTGAPDNAQEDPAEMLRLFQVLRDMVEDPQFGQKGEPWLRFAKFLDRNRDKIEGILRGNPPGKLTQEKLEKIIAEYGKFIAAEPVESPAPDKLETLEDYDKEFEYDPGWQKLSKEDRRLLLEYARLTPEEASQAKVDFSRVTPSMKVSMALKLTWKSWPGEIAEAAKSAFTDPTFLITFVVITGIYIGLWLTPDPSWITKALAGTLTAVLLAQFAWEDIYGFAVAYSKLYDECTAATTVDELTAAGDRFAKKVGSVGFDIILFIVMWRVGKKVGPKLEKIGAKRGVARAEAAVKAAEARPGSGVTKQAVGEAAKLLDTAKSNARGTTATAVLNALAELLPEAAKKGLADFRAERGGDMKVLKALEARAAKGEDIGHFLGERAVPKEVRLETQKAMLEAEGKLARAKLIEMETMKDPALRSEAKAEQLKAAREALVQRLRAKLTDWGILEDPAVKKAAKGGDVNELTGQLGEAIQRTLLEAEYPASKGYRILSNLEIVREVPNFDSIAKWQAAEQAAGRPGNVGGLYEAGGKLWKSITEMDALVVKETPAGKLKPVEIESMKSGEGSTPSKAQAQNQKAVDGLRAIEAGEPGVKIFERPGKNTLGKERTGDFDLSGMSGFNQTTTRGTPGKGFTKDVPFPREILEWVARSLIETGLPPAGPATVPPLTTGPAERRAEEK